ncbi:MAG: CheR family methyltransferase [Treponema sp.]|nr:CheR family methyltransferase [Treponema sp.]
MMDTENMQIVESQVSNVDIAEKDDEQSQERKKQMNIDFKMVTFSLSGKDYAIDIMNVKEIAKAGHFTYVPNTLPFVVGVYNLRGEIIPILDMRLFFNIPIDTTRKVDLQNLLILRFEEQIFGIIVDKIDKVVGIQKSTIQPPHPLFGDINVKYISGVVEADKRLYILLDIGRIFLRHTSEEQSKQKDVDVVTTNNSATKEMSRNVTQPVNVPKNNVVTSEVVVEEKKEVQKTFDNEYKFILESLKNYKKFVSSPINENWTKHRFDEWLKERGESNIQLKNSEDATTFLSSFWSTDTSVFWSEKYADAIYALLPDNAAKQIVVWNPGCAKGAETYSLACVLKKRYPDAKIRLYAQDVDLLNVSNAPSLKVSEDYANTWLSPYLSKTANGSLTFSQEIKDSIMFEYHDCQNSNALPMTDIIFARDLLSCLEVDVQNTVISDFDEKLKGNGILILGENESIAGVSNFMEITVGSLTAYKKN